MKTIILIFLILILFTSFASAFEVEGYRLYPREKNDIDWIDIKTVLNNNLEVIFEDLSPIKEVYYNKFTNIYYIFKEKSEWMFYKGKTWENDYLQLVKPKLEIEKKETWELIYPTE